MTRPEEGVDQPKRRSGAGRASLLFWRGLWLRCPVCGAGGLFRSWFTMKERCPRCGFAFARGDSGYQLGAMALALVIPIIVWFACFFGILIATWPNPPWSWLQWGSVAFMVAFPLLFYPVSHTLAIALDLLFRPPDRHELRGG